jgi:hypothetical protein
VVGTDIADDRCPELTSRGQVSMQVEASPYLVPSAFVVGVLHLAAWLVLVLPSPLASPLGVNNDAVHLWT